MPERNHHDPGRRERTEGEESGPTIRWDDANARTISPTICTISATPKEFELLFGTKDFLRGMGQEQMVHGAEKIVLNPLIVKRLAASLGEVLSQYESRFGPLEPVPAGKGTGDGRILDVPDRGRALFDLVVALDLETALEHSFKICRGRFLENRFLLCVSRAGQEGAPDEKLKQACRELGMPVSFLREFTDRLHDANHVYFGFEEDGDRSLYKVYLEFRDMAEEKMRGAEPLPGPFLLHLGFKWDVLDKDRKALTRYEWHPTIAFSEIMARVAAMLPRRPGHDPLAVAEAVIGLASERCESKDAQYVEVTEASNGRSSFDINLYKSGVRMGEIKPFLMRLADTYDLDPQELALFCDGIASKRFGHLAGGADREGRDFVTVYYGVEYLQPAAGKRRADTGAASREQGGCCKSVPGER